MARRGRHDRRCEFHELHSVDGYTEYRSAFNPAWYVGFNRRGAAVNGRHWAARAGSRARRRRRRCRQFLKTNFARADVVPPGNLSPFGVRQVADMLRATTAEASTSPSSPRHQHHHRRHDGRSRNERQASRQQQQQQRHQPHQTVRTTNT